MIRVLHKQLSELYPDRTWITNLWSAEEMTGRIITYRFDGATYHMSKPSIDADLLGTWGSHCLSSHSRGYKVSISHAPGVFELSHEVAKHMCQAIVEEWKCLLGYPQLTKQGLERLQTALSNVERAGYRFNRRATQELDGVQKSHEMALTKVNEGSADIVIIDFVTGLPRVWCPYLFMMTNDGYVKPGWAKEIECSV